MAHHFRMLGPVQVLHDGEPIPLGPPKRRAMLAALLLEANHPAPLARLAEAVWPGTAPASAVANLRNHAAALRRLLPGRLTAFPGAYQLTVEPGELDIDEFVELTAAGRRALVEDDAATAVARLGGALALWRGNAAEDLPRGTALDIHLTALDHHRLDAFEDHAEALLSMGAHADIQIALRQHLDRHPLRERAWHQLMSALYRCGDVAAALATYHDARTALAERLGLEPGPELTALHRAMLDREPDLATPATRRPRAVPSNLPFDVDTLHGRDAELALAIRAVRAAATGGGPAAVAILGPAGTGKSAFAVRLARTLAGDFPDGQIALSFAGDGDRGDSPLGTSGIIAKVLDAFDFSGGTQSALARFHELLSTRRVLVLLDDVESPTQVRPLIPGGAGSVLVVVSRRHLATLDVATRLDLGPLDTAAAIDLLAAHVGRARLDGEPRGAAAIIAHCQGLPLALRIVGARLATRPAWPLAIVAEQLARNPLDVLQLEDLSLRDRLTADLSALGDSAARALNLLAARPGGQASAAELAVELTEPVAQATATLELLVDSRLVDSPAPGRYRVQGLLRHYATELPAKHPDKPACLGGTAGLRGRRRRGPLESAAV